MDIKQQAEEYLKTGRWEKAIAAFDEAIKAHPGDADLWNNRGMAFYRLGRYEQAMESYRQALKLDRGSQIVWDNMKRCLSSIYGEGDAEEMFAMELFGSLASAALLIGAED